MARASDRPQDVGRSHAKRRASPRRADALLDRYQAAMRAELERLLIELEPTKPAPGLGLVKERPKPLPIGERSKRWDLAIKLGRELGSALEGEASPAADADASGSDRRLPRGRVDYGGR